MSQKRQAQVSPVELQQEDRHDEESTNKRANSTNGNDQPEQDPGLNVNCKQSINLSPPPQDDDPIITQFRPVQYQWKLNDTNIKRMDYNDQTILHNYCKDINTTPLGVWRYLIETKGCDVNARDKNRDTSLHYALRNFNPNDGGDITVLRYLLNQMGVNVNINDNYSNTLLHEACDNINRLPLEIFKLLIETMGCNVNAQNKYKDTPLHNAFRYFNPNEGGDITVLIYLLGQKDVDRNIKGYNGRTILHYACEKINILPLEMFKLLIETKGVDVNVQDNDKNTPLNSALGYFNPNDGGDITVLTYLLTQKGIDVNIKGQYGNTILHLACICEIGDDRDDDDYDYTDSEDDSDGPEGNLDNHREAKAETFLCQIVEVIAERCVEQVLDETNLE
jgi:ankyrin repeat protein